MLNDRIVVGHSIEDDLMYLNLLHARCYIRDISLVSFYMNPSGGKGRLKDVAQYFLNAKIQETSHSSIVDSRIAIALFRLREDDVQKESQGKVGEQLYLSEIYCL